MDALAAVEMGWRRLRPARAALLVTGALMLLAGCWLGVRATVPSDGAPVISDPGFRHGLTVDPLSNGHTALRPNDVVVAIDHVRVDDWLRHSAGNAPRIGRGTALTYRVMRHGHSVVVEAALNHDGVGIDRLRDNGGILLAAVIVLLLGEFTVYRRPDHPASRALLVMGGGLVAYSLFTTFGYDAADVAGARIVFWFGLIGAVATLSTWSVAAVNLAWTFPSPPRFLVRRRWLIPATYAVALLATAGIQAGYLLSDNATLTRLDRLTSAASVVLTVLAVLTLLGLGRTLLRARRDPTVRAQSVLVAAGFATTVVVLVIANAVAGSEKWPAWLDALLFLPLPISIAIAIVRGEFLEIRAVVNRTLVYGTLTAVLLGAYAGAVAAVAAIVGSTDLVSTFVATGIVAVAFAPLRSSLQRSVDRVLYGQRGDPARVLGALGDRLEAAVPSSEVLPAIAETVATTLNLPYVALRTGEGTELRLACERGEPVANTHVVPLVHQGLTVGELVVGARRGERAISAADAALLGDIARQIAAAVSAASLLTDLAASRRRLTVAREEERARLRHDLHDRLGPHLVGLSLQLDNLQTNVDPDTAAEIARAHDEATRALDEVRRISRGLRPAELDELGLVEAIGAAAARLSIANDDFAWRATVDAAVQLGVLPQDIEAAAYQIALEALSNAYRHSGGQTARVHVGVDAAGTELSLEIADDGRGMCSDAPEGVGIRSMHARAKSVNGRLVITTSPTSGTVVRASLPLSTP